MFQRVPRTEDSVGISEGSATGSLTQPALKNHRAVSTGGNLGIERTSAGVPIVRTPAVGDQLKSKRRPLEAQVQPQKEDADSTESVAGSSPQSCSSIFPKTLSPSKRASGSGAGASSRSIASPSLRRFHISTPTTVDSEDSTSDVLHRVNGGIQKKRSTKFFGSRPVVIEKTPSKTLAAKANSVLAKATTPIAENTSVRHNSEDAAQKLAANLSSFPTGGQGEHRSVTASTKRHVVNDAEKKWKETRPVERVQRTRDMSSNKFKKGESVNDDPNNWDLDSERLADELAQVALEMTNDTETLAAPEIRFDGKTTSPPRSTNQSLYKPALKYQPRLPKGGRHSQGRKGGTRFDGSSEGPDISTMEIDKNLSGAEDEKVQNGEKPAEGHHKTASTQEVPSVPPPADHEDSADSEMADSETGYIYDDFIRRRIHELDTDSRMTYLGNGEWSGGQEKSTKDIGVVVITKEDVHHWDAFAEDEEKDWDTEDEDSNGELIQQYTINFMVI